MKISKALAGATILLSLAVLVLVGINMKGKPAASLPGDGGVTQQPGGDQPTASVSYACNEKKTLTAAYFEGTSTTPTSPTAPPVPIGWVALALSDGRSMSLNQTISADGGRYANADESFVFWSKGRGALILENNVEKSYIGCTQVAKDPGGLPNVYQSGANAVTLRYPEGYTVDDKYKYQALGPGKDINGVKFTIPKSLTTGTNLSSDSYLSVEYMPHTKNTDCSARPFLDYANMDAQNQTEDGTDYSLASSTGAGAGNRYEETVYGLQGTNPCVAVRYYIHYGAIENYEPGAVKAFDKMSLLSQFDAIRRTLEINQ